MRATLMGRADGAQIDAILTHPAHQQTLRDLIDLIGALRACRSAEDMLDLPPNAPRPSQK